MLAKQRPHGHQLTLILAGGYQRGRHHTVASFLRIVTGGDAVSTLPNQSSREQSNHANNSKDDVRFSPDHSSNLK